MLLWWRRFRRRCSYEKVHLRPRLALGVDPECDLDRVPQRDRSERGEESGVLRLVPFGREAVRRADDEGVSVDLERLGGLEPGAEGLIRELEPSALEKARPDIGRGEVERFHGAGRPSYGPNVDKS